MVNQRFRAIYGLDSNGLTIENVGSPAAAGDAATKGYADGLVGNVQITGKLLTNFSASDGSQPVLDADTILQGFNKLQGQMNERVIGPAASTNNAIARFDLATGKVIKNSSATISDNGTINIPTAQTYQINSVTVLSGNALGTGITGSSLTSVGTLTSGAIGAGFTTIGIAFGGTAATTATAAFDNLSPTTTLGDIIFRGASNNVRLAGNTTTARQFLAQTGTGSVSAAPAWTSFSNVLLSELGAPTANVAFNSQRITGLADPVSAQDAATKAYVDAVKTGLDIKDSVHAASTASVTVTYNATGGTSARGQITAAPNVLDGVTLVNGDRILLKDQGTPAQNGIWVVTTAGTGANGVWDRATDFDSNAEVTPGAFTFVEEGTVNSDSGWVLTTNAPIVVGGNSSPSSLTWAQFSGAGQITAGAGLTKNGNTIDVVGTANRITVSADSIDIASTYVGQNTITTLGIIATGTWQGTAVGAQYGGTGQSTYVVGDLLFASTTTALSRLAGVALGNVLISGGVGTAPSWGKVNLTTGASQHVTGTLPVNNGGTGVTTATANQVFAAPNGTSGAPTFRSLVVADLPDSSANLAGSYGGAQTLVTFTVDAKGRLTAAAQASISGLTTTHLAAAAGILNTQLANSSVTIGSTAVSLGGTVTTIAGLTSLTATTLAGTLSTAAQESVTSLGTLTSLTISGNLTVDTNTLAVDSANNRVLIGNQASMVGAAAGDVLRVVGDIRATGTIHATDFVLTGGAGSGVGIVLNNLDDVIIGGSAPGIALADGHVLQYDLASSQWRNKVLTTTLSVENNGTLVAARQTLNFIPGTGVTFATSSDASKVNLTINATGNVASVFGQTGTITTIPNLTIDSMVQMDTFTLVTSATTANQIIGTLPSATYRSVKYLVQVVSGTAYQVLEILATHDNTTVYLTEYAVIRSGASLATFDVTILSGNLRLLTTPVNAATTYKVLATAIVV